MAGAVETVAGAVREAILEGDLAPGERLVEHALTERHGAARHTVRAALRALEAEGLVRIEPNRGARVAAIDEAGVRRLYDLRTALEVEAARRVLARHDGRLPPAVHAAGAALGAAGPRWSDVAEAHAALHHALVVAAGSPGLAEGHAALLGPERLFLAALGRAWSRERMAAHHDALLAGLERDGVDVLRAHLDDGLRVVLSVL